MLLDMFMCMCACVLACVKVNAFSDLRLILIFVCVYVFQSVYYCVNESEWKMLCQNCFHYTCICYGSKWSVKCSEDILFICCIFMSDFLYYIYNHKCLKEHYLIRLTITMYMFNYVSSIMYIYFNTVVLCWIFDQNGFTWRF